MAKIRTGRGYVTTRLGVPDGGVRLGATSDDLGASQSPFLENTIFRNNMLHCRFGQETAAEAIAEGAVHGITGSEFFGYILVHIGTKLIRISEDGEAEVLYEEMTDADSLLFEMNTKLYIFLPDIRILSVDKDFTVTEEEPAVKVTYTGANYFLGDGLTAGEVSDNLLACLVEVHYFAHDVNVPHLVLPVPCDTSLPFSVVGEETGRVYPKENFIASEGRLTVAPGKSLSESCVVRYYPKKGEEIREFDRIFGCRVCRCYGGNSAGGTRVFFAGNPEYCGHYFMSELLSPLVVKRDSFDIIGNGSEDIVALEKQKDELCAFCRRSVYGIRYSFSESTGADFRVRQISAGIGCDMPGSIRLVDNRLVFASSGSGIYIIVSSEYTDELSVRKISANIEGRGAEVGFFREDKEALLSAVSCDYGRKYMLLTGENAYVWDYGASPYYAGARPDDAEKALCWVRFTGLCEKALFVCGTELYGLCADLLPEDPDGEDGDGNEGEENGEGNGSGDGNSNGNSNGNGNGSADLFGAGAPGAHASDREDGSGENGLNGLNSSGGSDNPDSLNGSEGSDGSDNPDGSDGGEDNGDAFLTGENAREEESIPENDDPAGTGNPEGSDAPEGSDVPENGGEEDGEDGETGDDDDGESGDLFGLNSSGEGNEESGEEPGEEDDEEDDEESEERFSVRLVRLGDDVEGDFGEDIPCVYRTRDVDLGDPTLLKVLCGISFEVPASVGGVSHIDVYGDDSLIYSSDLSTAEEPGSTGVPSCPNGIRRISLRIPEFRCARFSFGLSSKKGIFGLANPSMRFFVSGKTEA